MILGFIGTGKIASSVITGICNSKISFKKILISERNKKISKSLNKKFKKISIVKNNQDIINSSNWIFLSVTPTVGEKIIKNLKFKSSILVEISNDITNAPIKFDIGPSSSKHCR